MIEGPVRVRSMAATRVPALLALIRHHAEVAGITGLGSHAE